MTRVLGIAIVMTAVGLWAARGGALSGGGPGPGGVLPAEGCPETAEPTDHRGTTLQQFAAATNQGVVYDEGISELRLQKAGGSFQVNRDAVVADFNVAAGADFDGDGWDDLIVGHSGNRFIDLYQNRTFETPAPDWSDPTQMREPRFVFARRIQAAHSAGGHATMAAGDFNQDGKADFVYFRNEGGDHTTMTQHRVFLGNGDGTFQPHYDAVTSAASLGYLAWSSTSAVVADWNSDGWPDILLGTKLGTSNNTGAVLALINDCPDVATTPPTPCSVSPRFQATPILTGLSFGDRGANAITYGDFTGNGVKDLIIGSPSSAHVRLYPGMPGGGIDASFQTIPSFGAATVTLAADFSLDGKLDLVYGTDEWNWSHPSHGGHPGGYTYYYQNNGTSTPFSGGVTQQLSQHEPHAAGNVYDFDLGIVMDYDHDPDGTLDFIIADGNHAGAFFVFANRVVSTYVACGDVVSGVLDLGAREDQEMVVTAARLRPDLELPPGTSATFYLSNEEPPNWQTASPCPDDPGAYCVSFPKPVGRDVRWKATLCSNAPDHTRTPTISGVEIAYDFTPARVHYRAGVVVSDGVVYLGGFAQPGDRGHFYALDASLTTVYWDAAAILDQTPDGAREVFTARSNGRARLPFAPGAAGSPALQATLGAASPAQAGSVIGWQRSARFGLGNAVDKTRLGSVETSTPAVMPPPARPVWYHHASGDERRRVDDFLGEHANRPTLVFFGSKDGALHAVHSNPADLGDPRNGREAWAFIPAHVAFDMRADAASGKVTAYPDGSPALADVVIDGALRTVVVVASGNGGKGVFALDVTDTVDAETGEVRGPEPLWHVMPGGAGAGQAFSKPVIARLRIDGDERFAAIVGTGVGYDDPSPPYNRGRDVYAMDVATGERLWRFRARCSLTSDVLVFETSDELEPGGPVRDGYIDRVVFADACGYVYKLDPGRQLPGAGAVHGWNPSANLGAIDTGAVDGAGQPVYALFSTTDTPGALGEARPIAGTLGARPDATGRVVLFFGTGGIESYDPTRVNEFYAVYADTGAIRSKLTGTCDGSRCEKFYGGVVVTGSQVLLTRSIDPPVGSGACELGQSVVQALGLDALEGEFVEEFGVAVQSGTVSSLYGDAGAIYFTTLGGDVVRVGTPAVSGAGGGAGNDGDSAGEPGAGPGLAGPLSILGWRQVL